MIQLKRRLKIVGQHAFALVALVSLILSLPVVAILVIIHYCKAWTSAVELKSQGEIGTVEKPISLKN